LAIGSKQLAVGNQQLATINKNNHLLFLNKFLDMKGFKDLVVYQKAFALAMDIFEITKKFPKEETYSLIDQIRRSSRSVCGCIAESYRKRKYPAHFVSKLTDADMENSETAVWIDFSFACNYIPQQDHTSLIGKNEEVGRLLGDMIQHPEKFL
jgi:four helix bundle protein